MKKHWKKIVAAVAGLAVIVVAASFIYAKVINDAPDKLNEDDLTAALADSATTVATADAPVTTVAAADPTTAVYGDTTDTAAAAETTAAPAATEAPATDGAAGAAGTVDGDWNITEASTLRYRVTESINGFDTEGVGTTNKVTGTLTIAGTTASVADFTVDMTTFTSDESRRDGQFNGRIMSVDEFPTSNFRLTSPIEFGTIPAEGETITASATGDLTLRGVTKSVTFDLTATLSNGKVGVLGNIPVLFSDYGIPNPSFATISTEDNGLLEFILVFEKA